MPWTRTLQNIFFRPILCLETLQRCSVRPSALSVEETLNVEYKRNMEAMEKRVIWRDYGLGYYPSSPQQYGMALHVEQGDRCLVD